MSSNILINGVDNEKLLVDGFIKKRFFDEGSLQSAYAEILGTKGESAFTGKQNPGINVTYHSTFLDKDQSYKQTTFDIVSSLFLPLVNGLFDNYKIIQANVFNKPPGSGFVCPHQNLTTVDESQFTSVSLWAPLQHTGLQNGTLCFAPGSHRKFSKFRNHNIDWLPLKVFETIEDYGMIPVEVEPGEVLLFDDSIVHGSPVNESGNDRIVFHCLAIPQEAPSIYCKKNGDEMLIIQVEDDFWKFFTPGDAEPEGPVIKRLKAETEKYTPSSILRELHT